MKKKSTRVSSPKTNDGWVCLSIYWHISFTYFVDGKYASNQATTNLLNYASDMLEHFYIMSIIFAIDCGCFV